MNRKTFPVVVLVAYLSMWGAVFASRVGSVGCEGYTVDWWFAGSFLLVLTIPAVLGYFIGRS